MHFHILKTLCIRLIINAIKYISFYINNQNNHASIYLPFNSRVESSRISFTKDIFSMNK